MSLEQRLGRLVELEAYREAERLAAEHNLDVNELIAEARRLQALAARWGRRGAVRQIAAELGVDAEALWDRVEGRG